MWKRNMRNHFRIWMRDPECRKGLSGNRCPYTVAGVIRMNHNRPRNIFPKKKKKKVKTGGGGGLHISHKV